MAENMGIERPLSEFEKKGTAVLGNKTWDKVFADKLHDMEQECTKKHIPFDRTCAIHDFNDRFDSVRREIERGEGGINEEDKRLKIDLGDLRKYAEATRFDTLGESDDVVNRNVDGLQVPTRIGVTKTYMCKARGHKFSVFNPNQMAGQIKEAGK